MVLDGGASQTCQLERIAGCSIIGESRGSSAHLHRPWRASQDKITNFHFIEISINSLIRRECHAVGHAVSALG